MKNAARTLIVCLTLVVVYASAVLAVDVTLPAEPAPWSEPSTNTAKSPEDQVKTGDQVSGPINEIPSPIEPSTPVGPVPHPQPVTELPGNCIAFYADHVRTTFENDKPLLTTVCGNVTARYRNLIVTAAKGEVDYKTRLAVFEGNVCFKIGVQEAHGERVEFNIDKLDWSVKPAKTTITPEFAKGKLRAPVFAGATEVSGIRDRQMSIKDADITTCDLPHTHYDLTARSVSVFPNDKIVFRHATFTALGRRLVTLRRVTFPIKEITKNPSLIPRIGNSAEEGAYVKLGYTASASKSSMTFLNADLMQRKGIGIGVQNYYKTVGGKGEIYLYALNDKNISKTTLTGRFNHSQMLFGDVLLAISSDLRSNSYTYAPQSMSFENKLSFTRSLENSKTSLAIGQSVSSVYTRTETLTGSLIDKRTFDSKTYLNTSFAYTGYNYSNGTRARLVSQTLYSKRGDKYDWGLSAQQLTDLSDEAFVGKGVYGGIEKLPELSISSDTARLGNFLPFNIPGRLSFSYGKFTQLPSIQRDRTLIDINTPSTPHKISNTWTALFGGGFKQFAYSDNTAQYSLDASAQLSKNLTNTSTFALTYRYQQPRGYTPFRFDYVGKYNILNANLDINQSDKFKFSLIGGYNFQQPSSPWQDSVLRFSIQASPSLLFYTATGYDFNNSQWRQVINQVRIRAGKEFKLDIGSRYNPLTSELAVIKGALETPVGDKLHVQALAGWDGTTNSFDYRSIKITRDLHCWEASVIFVDQGGFYHNQGIYFNMRIKAFPYLDNFGMGNFGQALDTSVGQVY